ncbi:hypothetical protein UA08_06124 [Talaromyces atroroseus]|uniref:Alpha-ketoglutarate-dependent sulfonate dioxygenase n=1 Tax=Talaromyces atroroseus TaxID=1441469 RepID=A0A225AK13_TALAT|nr:hypothetical protein UA08_06124 [Talaromyces atroroseus]OKL58634.1 hypothetical protein UA08_06124 [Talaromyces atroroseus]
MTAEWLSQKLFEKHKHGSAPSSDGNPAAYDPHFPGLGGAEDKPVTQDQCILHLKLLAALADLRATVSAIDGLFGIYDSQAEKFDQRTRALVRIKEKRWEIYVSRAVDRYAEWWTKVVPSGQLPTVFQIHFEWSGIMQTHQMRWSARDLPPLDQPLADILMVWHAHMLNPRAYLEDCIRASKMALWNTEFPWQLIGNAVNPRSFDYQPGEEAARKFTEITGRLWDNMHEPMQKELECLRCLRHFNVPWTTGEIGSSPDFAFGKCTGYADKSFKAYCKCGFEYNHQVMRVARFRKDVEDLLASSHPMPGTYLNLEGIPESLEEFSFPNDLIKAGDRVVYNGLKPGGNVNDMIGVRNLVESQINDPYIMQSINGGTINGAMKILLTKEQKIGIRRMMSHYWENSSIFGLDLVGAVIRQGVFIQKMDNLDWLHSPTLPTTMDRLIRKYTIYLEILFRNPGQMAVPTLDIDLAWHTHQLSAFRYYAYTTSRTTPKTFINHDDKVSEGRLSDAFEWTSKEYKRLTNGELYSECTCWYCEATREPILYPGNDSILSSSSTRHSRTLAKGLRDDPRISSEPDKSPHISTHNAVRSSTETSFEKEIRRERLRQAWTKAIRRAHKHRRTEGDATGEMMVWGYPYRNRLYAPYMVDPSISVGPYPSSPGLLNASMGGYGDCAAGTCANMVAAGECVAKNGGPDHGSFFDNVGKLVDGLDDVLDILPGGDNGGGHGNCSVGGAVCGGGDGGGGGGGGGCGGS